MGKKQAYCIKKFYTTKTSNSQKEIIQETFMVNNHSEVQEYAFEGEVDKVVEMLNSNSDSNCRYIKVTI